MRACKQGSRRRPSYLDGVAHPTALDFFSALGAEVCVVEGGRDAASLQALGHALAVALTQTAKRTSPAQQKARGGLTAHLQEVSSFFCVERLWAYQ